MTKWVTKKLGEIGRLVSGLTYSPNNVVDEGVLVLRSSNIQNDNICLEDNVYVNVTEYNPVQEGDILICVRNGSRALIGKTARINKYIEGCAFGAFMAIYRSEYNDFLYHFFKSDNFFSQVSRNIGATINSINGSDLKNMEVFFPINDDGTPDLAEQRRIAGILSSADGAIAASEALIEKYRNIKRGLLTTLLQPKEGWKKVKLGECLKQKPDYGINAPAVAYDNKLPTYLRITDITEDGYYSKNDVVSVADPDAYKYKMEEGDLVFARTGASVGKTYLYNPQDGILVFAGFLIRVKTDENILLSSFFKYQTQTQQYKNWIANNSMRTGQPGINGNEYETFSFFLPYKNGQPDLAEQRRIAEILSSVDAKIAAEENVVEKYKGVKKGLMEEMMGKSCEM